MATPSLPARGSTGWDLTWAKELTDTVRNLEAQLAAGNTGGGSTPSTPLPQPSSPYQVMLAPARVVNVSTRTQLLAALADVRFGDKIVLAAGSYGALPAATPIRTPAVTGYTNSNPCPGVWIQGAPLVNGQPTSIIGGGSTGSAGYSCALDNANYLVLDRVKITGGQKGLMADQTNFARIINCDIGSCGHEAVHFRNNSSDNVIDNCTIHDTGLDNPDYGEGVYFGQSVNNWDASMSRTNGQPDKSDRNVVQNSRILDIAGECVDAKEGTTGGAILNNTMSGKDIAGTNSADSYVDIKGNNYRIEGNTCTTPATFVVHGMSVHILYAGYGNNNVFKKNSVVAGGKTSGAENSTNGGSQGYNIQTSGSRGTTTGNIVYSDNTATANPGGLTNLPVTAA